MARVTLRQLEYFVAAAETGSVTAAAARVLLSQSAVSTALAELEDGLGVQLFLRHARGLTLTSVGHSILRSARQLLAQADDLERSAEEHNTALSGRLTVGCYSTLAPHLLPPVLDAFLTSNPAVDLNFVVGSHASLRSKLLDGTCDVALLYDYDFAPGLLAGDVRKIPLQSIPPYVLLPRDHELARQESIPLRRLVDEPLILFDLPPGGEYFRSFFTLHGLTPTIRFRTTEFELVRALVARGLGYSILNQPTDIDVSYEGLPLATRPLAGEWHGLPVVAVHLAGSHLTRRATAFIGQCRKILGADAHTAAVEV
ncbi:LysR family transcriptional regulator [Microbacterium sp.]|uniref:LysR family transcriptional regulator n=1 Tax=Microbacterium sp. TaxID=51671 RepID=UPI003C793A01